MMYRAFKIPAKAAVLLVPLLVLISALSPVSSARAQAVDLLLVLAVDCSFSVNSQEYYLQMGAIGDAFKQPEIKEAIASGPNASIAIALVQWSSNQSQVTVLPWTRVTAENADGIGDRIATIPRSSSHGSTSISSAIYHSLRLFDASPFYAVRNTIDVSADGRNNNGPEVTEARDFAVSKGVTVNGLAILLEDRTLDIYFRRDVIGGIGSFVIKATDYRDFRQAIRRKLQREIQYIPVAGLAATPTEPPFPTYLPQYK